MFRRLLLSTSPFFPLLALLILTLLPFTNAAWAHPLSAAYSKLEITNGSVNFTFSIDDLSIIEHLKQIDTNQDKKLDEAEVNAATQEISNLITSHIMLTIDGTPSAGQFLNIRMEPKNDKQFVTTTFIYPGVSTGQAITVEDDFYTTDKSTMYVNLLSIHTAAGTNEAILEGSTRLWEKTAAPEWFTAGGSQTADEAATEEHANMDTSSLFAFFLLGADHILFGYDHLLFLFALILCHQTIKQYIAIITSFTLAHSLTLTLAALGLVEVPGRFIEIVVALSICYVALENIIRDKVDHRWTVTFFFGLIHGFGFATIMQEMEIPTSHLVGGLISFNIGIEAAQLGIVLLVVPLLARLQKTTFYKPSINVASGIIVALGGFWLFERLFLG